MQQQIGQWDGLRDRLAGARTLMVFGDCGVGTLRAVAVPGVKAGGGGADVESALPQW